MVEVTADWFFKIEPLGSCEISGASSNYVPCHDIEDYTLYVDHHENMKSYKHLLLYVKFSNSMEQSSSWGADSCSANQEIPHSLSNLNVHCHIHKSQPLYCILNQLNSVLNLILHLLRSILTVSSHVFPSLPSVSSL
jgi:hypothetical protein